MTLQDNLTVQSLLSQTAETSRLFRTSIGPQGLDKLIVDGDTLTITNDGAAMIREMRPKHPVSQLLAELATAQESDAGDGTTTTLLLAGFLCEELGELIRQGHNPARVRLRLGRAVAAATTSLLAKPDFSKNLDLGDLKNPDHARLFRSIVKNSLSSKAVVDKLASLSEVLLQVAMTTEKTPELFTMLGHSMETTQHMPATIFVDAVFPGRLDIPIFDPVKFSESLNARKAVFLSTPILSHTAGPKPWLSSTVTLSSAEQLDALIAARNTNFRKLVRLLGPLKEKQGVSVIFYMQRVTDAGKNTGTVLDEKFVNFLNRKGFFIAEMKREAFEKTVEFFGVRPLVRLDQDTDLTGYTVKLSRLQKLDSGKLCMSGPSDSGSIFVSATNKVLLDETKRSIEDVLGVVTLLRKGGSKVIRGGGVFEIEAARLLRAQKCEVAMRVACAIESVVVALANNGGLNGTETLADMKSGKRASLVEGREEVWLPLNVPISALKLSAEMVTQLLKIDDIVETMDM